MIYGERTARSAFYVSADGTQKMKRIPFMSGEFSEAWLQELIEENPSILPAGEVGTEYSPILCIGREVPVGSGDTKGYITGHLVIVETKLFRNQESRRTVVAQIIDYAKELQQWDAETLDAVAGNYFYQRDGQASRVIDAMVAAGYMSYSDEAALTDAINDHLMEASFLLLIVGDGIRSNVYQLAEFLNDNTAMSFNLALAEIEIYQHGSDVVVVPNLLTKTTVIERKRQSYGPAFSVFSGNNITPVERIPYTTKPLLSRREFIETFASNGGYDPDIVTEFLSDMESVDGISITITPTELHIDCSPDGNRKATVLYFGISSPRGANIYMRPDRLRKALEASGHFPSESDEFLDFYKDYVDISKCKAAPYEFGANRFYYAHIGKVLESSSKFVGAAERLIFNIAEN